MHSKIQKIVNLKISFVNYYLIQMREIHKQQLYIKCDFI